MTSRTFRTCTFIFTLSLALGANVACAGNESRAKKAIEEYLKGQGTTNLTLDSYYPSSTGDRAYASATVTYNFANSSGEMQKEFLGFILAREGGGWRIERSAAYTTDKEKAQTYLAGGK
jgi:ketosteroid isomerase-like protein